MKKLYTGVKMKCYVTNFKIVDENIIRIQTGFKAIKDQETYFYKNILGVLIDVETNAPVLNPLEAKEYVETIVEINNPKQEELKDITCACVGEIKYNGPISNKELKTLRKKLNKK